MQDLYRYIIIKDLYVRGGQKVNEPDHDELLGAPYTISKSLLGCKVKIKVTYVRGL